MSTMRVGDVRFPYVFAGALTALLFCAHATPASAQGGCPGSQKKGDGADIQCRVSAALEKHSAVLEVMKGKVRECVGRNCGLIAEQLDRVEKANGRAKGQHGRMKASDYDEVNRARKGKCKAPDSTSNPNPNCYENPEYLEATDDTETEFGSDVVDQLVDIEEGLDRTATVLAELPADAPAAMALMSAARGGDGFRALYNYKDDPDYPAWLHTWDNPKALIPVAFAMTIATVVAKGAEKVAQDLCQQDFVGFNASAGCTILSVFAGALDGTAALLNYNLSDATAWDVHGAYLRAEDLNANLGVVDGRVGVVNQQAGDAATAVAALDAKIALLEAQVGTLSQRILTFQNQIIQLLLTQAGRRAVSSSILTCDGSVSNPCPQVQVECSPTTGLCTFK